jgi:RNA polymerase sigma factor (sigma-70 family)
VIVRAATTAEVEWETLMAAAQAGDAHAYRTLLTQLIPWLRRYYVRRLPLAATDDVIQDVLLAIHEKRHTYNPSLPFGPWLAAIARYKLINRLRAMDREPPEPLDERLGIPDHEDTVVARSTFWRLLATLKPANVKVVRLVKIEGYSIEEASKTSGQSVPLVKVNTHRGIKRLACVSVVRLKRRFCRARRALSHMSRALYCGKQ